MKLLSNSRLPLIVIVLSVLSAFYFLPKLPETVVTHWGLYGEPNGYSSKFVALFIMPTITTILYLMFLFLPKIDPLKHNIKSFEEKFRFFINIIIIFLFYIHILSLAWNLGYQFDMITFLVPAFSVLSYSIGILLEDAKKNWFVGIRTPWTLSSDEVWDKTHKFGSKLYKYAAILPLLGIIFPKIAFVLTILSLAGVSLLLVLYSYLEFNKLNVNKR